MLSGCYGHVTSLNGEPEPGVFVEAIGKDGCSMYQEESKTETIGHYRIRPKCTYEIRLQVGEMNKHIERAAPKSRLVTVEGSDFQDVNMIAFRRMNQMDISGNVVTDPEYLPTLKIYFVRLESSLSKSTHDFVQPEIELKANLSYKHITFRFEPKILPLGQQLVGQAQTFLQKRQAGVGFQQQQQQQQQRQQQQQHQPQQYPVIEDYDLPDSTVTKKKAKPRKHDFN